MAYTPFKMKGHTLPGINQRSPIREGNGGGNGEGDGDGGEGTEGGGSQVAAAAVGAVLTPAMEALLRDKPKVSGPNLDNPGESFAEMEIGTGSAFAKKSPFKLEPAITGALVGAVVGPLMGKLFGDDPVAPPPSLENPGEAFGKLKIGSGTSSKKPY
jgi:hypothetical protein